MSRYESEHPFEDTEASRDRRNRSDPKIYEAVPPRPKRKKWPLVLLMLLTVLVLLPNLIGWLGLQQRAINVALTHFNGRVSVEHVSLGWFQPIKLTNVTAVDSQGAPLFEVATATTSKPLYHFLISNNYGEFNVQSPTAHLQLRPGGSNLEDAIAHYLQPTGPTPVDNNPVATPAQPLPQMTINIVDGTAHVSSTSEARTWQIDQLNLVAETSTESAPLMIDAQCRIATSTTDPEQPPRTETGEIAFVSHIDSGSEILNFNAADLRLEMQDLPMSFAAPLLQRLIGPTVTTGRINGKIQSSYSAASNSVAMQVEQLNLREFAIVAPQLIGQDQFSLQHVTANGVIEASPNLVSAQQFNLQSDVGSLKAEGSLDLNQVTALATRGQLLETPFEMHGEVDLAALIGMLPSTFQLHQDLTINSGTVTFQAASQNNVEGRRLVVNLDTANLNAKRGQQNIVWAKPLRLFGTVKEVEGRLALEEVNCVSDFLNIRGNANLKTASFVAQGDLQKLMEQVSQFVDLQNAKLAGTLDGRFGWQMVDSEPPGSPQAGGTDNLPIQIGGSFVVDNPVIELPGMPRWQQPQMSIKLSGSGQSQSGGKLRLEQGGVQIDIGTEQLLATLAQPVVDAFTNQIWNTNCQMTGSMAGWVGHIQNFVDLGNIRTEGDLNLICSASLNPKNIQFSGIEYAVQQLAFDGYGMKIREAKTQGAGAAVYDLTTGSILFPELTVNSSSITARGQQVQFSFPSNMRADGTVSFRADVNKVADWYELSPTSDHLFWFGSWEGTAQLVSNENGIGARVNSTVSDLVAAMQRQPQMAEGNAQGQFRQASSTQTGWQEILRESKVGISGDFTLGNDFNALGFQNFLLDSSILKANANGSLTDLAGKMVADIKGVWLHDWQKVNLLLASHTGDLIKFAGQRQHQFVIAGPIFETTPTQPGQPEPWISPSLKASATFGWDQGQILNLPVGKSDLAVNLSQSIGFVETKGIPFAGGLIQFAPQIDLRGEAPAITMGQTRVINNVTLQPSTARQWLRFVAPLAADATSAQGNFSVDVGGANIPLFDPLKMEARGAIRLSNVVIGAGPTAQQLLATVTQLRAILKPGSSEQNLNTWLQLEDQTVPVLVREGRIFHENLRFRHKDLTIQTRGSVGLDQSLNMVAQIPIADDWIAGKDFLSSLRGKFISIPIGGTVSNPILDKSAIQNLSRELVRDAAGNALNKAIGDQLTPKMNQFQDQLNNKIGDELNKLQGKLGDGIFPNQPNGSNPGGQPTQDPLGDKLKEEFNKGIGGLFK